VSIHITRRGRTFNILATTTTTTTNMEINPLIKEGAVPFDLIESNLPKTETEWWLSLINPIQKHVDTIIIAFFIIWTALFCVNMDGPSLIELSYLPFIGIFAACLANAVPIGGGIVYIPALALLGSNMKVDVTFTVCTMSIGNGLFGFLKWLQKNPDIYIVEAFGYTVIPSSIGSIIGMLFLPQVPIWFIRKFFGLFCVIVGSFVSAAAYRGGVDKVLTFGSNPISASEIQLDIRNPSSQLFALISFLGGLFLVPNIGVGPALVTFVGLSILRYEPKRCIVTGIIVGGWVCIIPALLHVFIFHDVPIKLG